LKAAEAKAAGGTPWNPLSGGRISGPLKGRGKQVKRTIGFLLILVEFFSAAACDLLIAPSEAAGQGSLTIGFGTGGGTDRALDPADQAALRYELALTGPGDEQIKVSLSPGQTFHRLVALGEWRIYAEAFSPGGTLAGTGSTTVSIRPGNNPVRIPMRESGATVDNRDLTGLITAPVTGAAPVTTAIDVTQYTGIVAWKESNGTSFSGPSFAAATVYKAVVTLTAKSGFTFTGVPVDGFSYSVAASVTNPAGSGSTMTVTITFPATADEGQDTSVNSFGLTSLITAPVTGAAPDATVINATQYTGTIAWQNAADSSLVSGNFAAATVYKAVVTLAAKTGFTFDEVAADSFIYSGAASVTNLAGSGSTMTVTITFPATAPLQVSAFSLDGKVTAPVTGVTSVPGTINEIQYTGNIAWQKAADSSPVSGNFAAATVYKAVVTLTAKTGYTFTGVAADSFIHSGAASVTNLAGSGSTMTVTITFPQTEPASADNIRYVTPGGNGSNDGSTWANASDDLQAMIDAVYASAGPDEKIVHVAAGTYKPKYKPGSTGASTSAAGDRDCTFILRPGVILRGGYAGSGEYIDDPIRQARFNADGTVKNSTHETILSGDIGTPGLDSDNAYHVVLAVGIPDGSSTVLDGFTITGGYANGGGNLTVNSNNIPRVNGGGMCNWYSSPELRNVTIKNNQSPGTGTAGTGGGMYNNNSSPVLNAVTISSNTASKAGGGMYNNWSSPELTDVTVSGNSVSATTSGDGMGGGIFNGDNSAPVLNRVRIIGNTANNTGTLGANRGNGGGMYNSSSSPKLINVVISGNTAARTGTGTNTGAGGGIYNVSSSPVLINVLVSGNRASNSGGGIYVEDSSSSPELTNVTMAGNYASYGGAITCADSANNLTVTNSLIWGNVAGSNYPGINKAGGGAPSISYSLVQGESGGSDGNLVGNTDPRFVTLDAADSTTAKPGGDYQLQSGSPVINQGDDSSYLTARGNIPNFTGEKDLAGGNRKTGAQIDMGAYEWE
jgi:parallel beta-helix repeat protein